LRHAADLGNARVRLVAAHWDVMAEATRVQNAFKAAKFDPISSLRTRARAGDDPVPRRGRDSQLADNVLSRVIYSRIIEERESANDTIEYYVIVAGDAGYLEYIADIVENHRKKVRLLAFKGRPYLSKDYPPYEVKRRMLAATPGQSPEPGFQIDDLGPYADQELAVAIDGGGAATPVARPVQPA
jgi:hypothetical protein